MQSKPHVPSIASSKESNKSEPLNPERSRKKLEHKLRKEAYEVAVVNTAMTGRLMTKLVYFARHENLSFQLKIRGKMFILQLLDIP